MTAELVNEDISNGLDLQLAAAAQTLAPLRL